MTTSKSPRSSDGTRFDQLFWTMPRLDAEPARERVHDVDLEADDVLGVRRVLVDVGLAALEVGAPR